MSKEERERIMITEHTLEVRHPASGVFLDLRGYIADHVRDSEFLPHWNIDANVVNFNDDAKGVKKEGGFVGYKSAGYVVLDSPTRNFFEDRASAFWKLINENKHYELRELTRFGTRTKLFTPSRLPFEKINNTMYEMFFTDTARKIIGGKETDLNFTIELQESDFNVRVRGGPIKKDEASKYFQFKSDHFEKCGLFLDIDYYKTNNLSLDAVPNLMKAAMALTWEKAELIATTIGL